MFHILSHVPFFIFIILYLIHNFFWLALVFNNLWHFYEFISHKDFYISIYTKICESTTCRVKTVVVVGDAGKYEIGIGKLGGRPQINIFVAVADWSFPINTVADY